MSFYSLYVVAIPIVIITSIACFIYAKAREQAARIAQYNNLDSKSTTKPRRIAVIGAGCSGLVTARELLADGHDVTIFEASNRIGGVFSHFYQSGRLTTSTATTTFSTLSSDLDAPKVWNFQEYVAYLNRFVRQFQLDEHIEFHTKVSKIHRRGPKDIELTVVRSSGGQEEEEETRFFEHIAICTGIAQIPKEPALAGLEKFQGKIIHSFNYKNADEFVGKKVVVAGMGESGSDISLEIAKKCDEITLSVRRGPGYVIPRYFGGMPADIDTNRVYHSVPKDLLMSWPIIFKRWLEGFMIIKDDDTKVLMEASKINAQTTELPALQRYGTKNTSFVEAIVYHNAKYKPIIDHLSENRVHFADGSSVECDVIVCCTGFCVDFPYLTEHHPQVRQRATNPRALFKHCYDAEFGCDIVWIGYSRPGIGAVPTVSELAARYFVELVAGRKKLPEPHEMQRVIEADERRDLAYFPFDAPRIPALVDFITALNDYAVLSGTYPPMFYLFVYEFELWFKILFGPLNTLHYRVIGHGKFDWKVLKDRLNKLPRMPLQILFLEWCTLAWAMIVRKFDRLLYA